MEILNLIILIATLLTVLGFLVFLYVYKSSKKKKLPAKQVKSEKKVEVPSFKKLSDSIKNNASLDTDLRKSIELILKYYGVIKPKHGLSPNKDFKRYAEVIFAITTHHNTNKELVLMFDRELTRKNPSYKREIEEMLNRGLSARA